MNCYKKRYCKYGHDSFVLGRQTNGYCTGCYKKNIKKQNLSHYKLTLEEFNRLRINQLGLCAICSSKTDILCVDHNHKNKKVRGLLCHSCNKLLGFAKDNPKVLIYAACYLLKYDDWHFNNLTLKSLLGDKLA